MSGGDGRYCVTETGQNGGLGGRFRKAVQDPVAAKGTELTGRVEEWSDFQVNLKDID